MAIVKPPKNYGAQSLRLRTIAAGGIWRRLYRTRYPDPLGYGKTPSRFSDQRTRRDPANRFGVLYLGASLEVCFLEAFLRDAANGNVGAYPIPLRELEAWKCAEIVLTDALRVVDLTGNGPVRLRVPTDAVRGSDQRTGRYWSQAFFEHPNRPDGLLYPSRLNDQTNLALYDRALSKLACIAAPDLLACGAEFADVIRRLDLAIVS